MINKLSILPYLSSIFGLNTSSLTPYIQPIIIVENVLHEINDNSTIKVS